MSEWTARRLDDLPDGTVIGWTEDTYPQAAVRQGRSWRDLNGSAPFSEGVLEDADPGSIRVVSVPIDELLSQNALEAATDAFAMTTNLVGILGNEAEQAVRAAIAHITGKES